MVSSQGNTSANEENPLALAAFREMEMQASVQAVYRSSVFVVTWYHFQLQEDNAEILLAVVIKLRRALSHETAAPIDEAINAGLVPRLVELLDHSVRSFGMW